MKSRRSWEALAHVPTHTLRRRQDKALVRYLREELYALSPHYRQVLDQAGVDVRRLRGVADLAKLPFTEHGDLQRHGKSLVLTPSAHAMREHWGFTRKLALVLGGARAGKALRRGYEPATDITPASDLHAAQCTQHDLALLAEVGLRAALQMGIETTPLVFDNVPAPVPGQLPDLVGTLLSGASQLQNRGPMVQDPAVRDGRGELSDPECPPARATLLRTGALSGGRVHALDAIRSDSELDWIVIDGMTAVTPEQASGLAESAPSARIVRVYGNSELPMAFFEDARTTVDWAADPNGGPGFIVHPDLCILEVIDPVTLEPVADGQPGEVVYTSLAAHGRALLRYRTGVWAPRGLVWPAKGDSASGYLPLLSSGLSPLDSKAGGPMTG